MYKEAKNMIKMQENISPQKQIHISQHVKIITKMSTKPEYFVFHDFFLGGGLYLTDLRKMEEEG